MIAGFRGNYSFLSNFYPTVVPIRLQERWYVVTTSEHAYQMHKTLDPVYIAKIAEAPIPVYAKRLGKKAPLRSDWEEIKIQAMVDVVFTKFRMNIVLAHKLLATGDRELVETNHWGDTFWGVCNGKGQNNLGKILMRIREGIREDIRRIEEGDL